MIFWQWGQIKSNGYSDQFQEGFIEQQPDAGIPTRRQRFSDVGKIISGTFTLTKAEYLAYNNWYLSETQQGANSFQYYDCLLEDYRTASIVGLPTVSSNSIYFELSITFYLAPYSAIKQYLLVVNPLNNLLVNGENQLVVGVRVRA